MLTTNQTLLARNGGKVGIGTSRPQEYGTPIKSPGKLDVNGYAAANDVWLKDENRWASEGGGGGCFTFYCNKLTAPLTWPIYPSSGENLCADSGDITRGYCPAGFQQKYALGTWGSCGYYYLSFRPPGGACITTGRYSDVEAFDQGSAFVCCQ